MRTLVVIFAALLAFAVSASAETFFVANMGVNTVSTYDSQGNTTAFGSPFLIGPTGVALDRSGNLFVSTTANTIEKFSSAGVHLSTFATVGLNQPLALAFDRAGNLYAANFGDGTIQKFTPAGVGTSFATVVRATGLAFDALSNLYVSNFGNTIERFSPTGAALGTFAAVGLSNPEGLAFDSLGNLYAANNAANTVAKFSPTGVYLGVVAVGLSGPIGLVFDSAGSLYIVNSRSATITRVDESGTASLFGPTGFSPAFIAAQLRPTLINISTRLNILTGENVLDAGFIVFGPGSKTLLIRGLGPSLGAAGVEGALADPLIELHSGINNSIIASNDNWKNNQRTAIEDTGIPPTNDLESALITTLTAGTYTVIERGKLDTTGVGLLEIYDIGGASRTNLANISTRGFVDSGSNVMIAGFIVASDTGGSGEVIVRALGPSLVGAGVSNPLADPMLELHDQNGVLIAANDDWQSDQAAAIEATGIPPNNDAEAAIVATLRPGAYTAIESGKEGGTGVGLVEVYNLQ
ncbi:MAG: NHL repeat-containing protein [Verrucomicrobiota bacterium]|nr:NHL repeat-containing protein [Verrucomicrobiota bacterium]